MTKAIAKAGFDYDSVDKDTKGKLISLAGQVKRHGEKFRDSGLEIGEAIHGAHELLAGEGREGRFKDWVESETDIGLRTAYNCMYVYERSQKLAIVASLPPTVAYLMSAPGVPDAAIKDFEKQIDKGTRPTVAAAKATLNKFRTVAAKPRKKKTSQGISKAATPESTLAADSQETGDADDGPLNDEPVKELTFEEHVKEANSSIESFCRQLVKFFEDGCPKLGSVDHMGRYDSALAQVRAACSTLRTCKYQEEPCPKCKGGGCPTCEKESDFGAVSVLTFRQLAG